MKIRVVYLCDSLASVQYILVICTLGAISEMRGGRITLLLSGPTNISCVDRLWSYFDECSNVIPNYDIASATMLARQVLLKSHHVWLNDKVDFERASDMYLRIYNFVLAFTLDCLVKDFQGTSKV